MKFDHITVNKQIVIQGKLYEKCRIRSQWGDKCGWNESMWTVIKKSGLIIINQSKVESSYT